MMEFKEAIKNKDPKAAYREISGEVNNYGFDRKKALEDIRKDPESEKYFMGLSLLWVKACAEDAKQPWAYDDRNEHSVKICERLAETRLFQMENVQGYLGQTDKRMVRQTVDELRNLHRTLMQTFSSLVFYYLREKAAEDEKVQRAIQKLNLEYVTGWERCPLI